MIKMRLIKKIIKKIWSRLLLEAIIGIVLLATYENWGEIKAAFSDSGEGPEE